MPLSESERTSLQKMSTPNLAHVIKVSHRHAWRLDARSLRELTEMLESRPDLTYDGAELIVEIRACHLRPNVGASR